MILRAYQTMNENSWCFTSLTTFGIASFLDLAILINEFYENNFLAVCFAEWVYIFKISIDE